MLHGSAQLQLNPPPGGDAEVAKQPGDVAQGSGGDALSLLQASVPGADSNSDDAAKTRSSEPRGAALRDLPQPWLPAPGSHSHKGQILSWAALLESGWRRQPGLGLLSLYQIHSLAGPEAEGRGTSLARSWACSLVRLQGLARGAGGRRGRG